jgi:hypothetical protein
MVRAILDGRKTMTRRVVKPSSVKNYGNCPYGQIGDRLWVRETFYCDHAFYPNGTPDSCQWKEKDGIKTPFLIEEKRAEMLANMYYRADGEPDFEGAEGPTPWKPSIHMPRWACRIELEVTGVRVERLQDISLGDVDREGAPAKYPSGAAKMDFQELWESINGAGSWEANPWVWVVEFRRVL